MNSANVQPARRSVAGHVAVAMAAGGAGGATIAATGALVAVLWPGGEDPIADPGALVGLPTVFGLFGAALGLVLGLVVGLATPSLRRRDEPPAGDGIVWVLGVVVSVGGGVPLGWVWGDAMGAGLLPRVGAMAYCLLLSRPVARLGLRWLLGADVRRRSGRRGRWCRRRPGATAPSGARR